MGIVRNIMKGKKKNRWEMIKCSLVSIYKQKCFLHLIQQPKYEMVMPCKADYSPAKSFYDVKNLSGLIYKEGGEAERLRTG